MTKEVMQQAQELVPMQGLADYLQCEAGGVYVGHPSHTTLMQWAKEVDAAQVAQPLQPLDQFIQAVTDPENQPSQYGTITLDYHFTKLKEWEERFNRAISKRITAILQPIKPVAEVTCDGVMGVSFLADCNYGCDLPAGTKLYIAQPVQPKPEKDAVIAQLQGMVAAWKEEAEHQYGQLRLQRNPSETDYPVLGALDAYARGKYAALRNDIAQPKQPADGLHLLPMGGCPGCGSQTCIARSCEFRLSKNGGAA